MTSSTLRGRATHGRAVGVVINFCLAGPDGFVRTRPVRPSAAVDFDQLGLRRVRLAIATPLSSARWASLWALVRPSATRTTPPCARLGRSWLVEASATKVSGGTSSHLQSSSMPSASQSSADPRRRIVEALTVPISRPSAAQERPSVCRAPSSARNSARTSNGCERELMAPMLTSGSGRSSATPCDGWRRKESLFLVARKGQRQDDCESQKAASWHGWFSLGPSSARW